MPSAAGRIEPPASEATAAGSAVTIASTGSVQPITPVEHGSTARGARPSSRAVSAHTRSLAATPPGAQTLEILLFTMIAPSAGSPSRERPTITGAPGNAFFVNIAAKSAVGFSSATSVSVIFAGFGASRGVKSKRVVPTRKPAGSAACVASHARCSERFAKTSWVLGTPRTCGSVARSEAEFSWRKVFPRVKIMMEINRASPLSIVRTSPIVSAVSLFPFLRAATGRGL
jgi:hypothetical protein